MSSSNQTSEELEMEDKIEEASEPKKSIFEKWTDKFRDFLDNAE